MKRSRKGLFGVLALAAAAVLGSAACSPAVTGWHAMNEDFYYGPTECVYQLKPNPLNAANVQIKQTAGSVLNCAATGSQISIVVLSCVYDSPATGWFYWDEPGDTCPATQANSAGTGTLLFPIMGRTQGAVAQG